MRRSCLFPQEFCNPTVQMDAAQRGRRGRGRGGGQRGGNIATRGRGATTQQKPVDPFVPMTDEESFILDEDGTVLGDLRCGVLGFWKPQDRNGLYSQW